MKKNVKLKLTSFFWIFVIVFLFVGLSYFVQTYMGFFENFIADSFFGMAFYVFLNVVATVVAPISALPLIALASGLWGVWVAAFLSVVGWTVGAVIAFLLARRFGLPLVRKLISLDEVYAFQDRTKVGNTFWSVLFLRMIVPADVLSYALGLFSKIRFWPYFVATFFGIIPFAIIFAYLGGVRYIYQAVLGLVFLIVVICYMIYREIKSSKTD